MADLIPAERIENKIYLIRGHKVMLDRNLAKLYGVKTFVLNQAIKRNKERFPEDFMFQLNQEELKRLRSQIVILEKKGSKSRRGKHTKYLPFAFTEQGVAMLSSVLRSQRAIQVNIQIMRTFVKLKKILSTHKDLEQKINLLENKFDKHVKKNSAEIQIIFKAIRSLMEPPERPKRKIGFLVDSDKE